MKVILKPVPGRKDHFSLKIGRHDLGIRERSELRKIIQDIDNGI